jgi:cytochrome c553
MRICETARPLAVVILIALAWCLSPLARAASDPPGDVTKGKAIAERVCYFCHGLDGRGLLPRYPVLAGQHTDYLIKQLTRFTSGAREHFIMNDITSRLTPQDVRDVAAYMNAQVPQKETTHKPAPPVAEAIFQKGKPADGVPACQTCHGPRGAGQAALLFPRLAGQHPEYLVTQLKAFQNGERNVEPGNLMHDITLKLSDQEIEALANYLAGLD